MVYHCISVFLLAMTTTVVIVVQTQNIETESPLHCPEHEELSECLDSCEPTCSNVGQPCTEESTICTQGCTCVDGYARNDQSKCISIQDCRNFSK